MSKINKNQKHAHYCSLFSGWNSYLKQQQATLFKYYNVHLLIICWAGKQLNKNRWLASFMLHINLCYCVKWLQSLKLRVEQLVLYSVLFIFSCHWQYLKTYNVHLKTLSVGFETKDSSKLLFRQLYTLQSHINIFTHNTINYETLKSFRELGSV